MNSLTIPVLNIRYTRRELITMLVIFAAYVAFAQIGRLLFTAPAVIQPAAGVALASLVLGGLSLWPAVFAGAILNGLLGTSPFLVMVGSIVGHTLHAVIGAWVLRTVNFDPVFRRVRDTLAFILVALFVSMIVPTIGLLSIYVYNEFLGSYPVRTTWLSWWIGIMIGDLILAIAVVRYFAKVTFTRTPTEIGELLFAFLSVGVLSYGIAWTDLTQISNGVLLLFFFLPFIWFSLRLGNRFTFLAFLLSTTILLTGVLYSDVPTTQVTSARIITTELFMATLAVIFFLFTAVVEERKRANKALAEQLIRIGSLLEETKRQDRAKSDFIAVFAHELRNPLAPIVSSIELLKLKHGAHPEIAPIVDTVEDRTKTIVRLLDDLLDVSRIERQRFPLRREEYDLRESVRRVSDANRALTIKHGLTLRLSLPEHAVPVHADALRIEQMIGNILMNAIKYTDTGGIISLSLSTTDEHAVLSIKDTGVGIAPEFLNRIFVPFAGLGVEHRQKSIKEGIGIGLWLTENLAKVHGGTIEARSEGVGKGSEFIVHLPRIKRHTITTNEYAPMESLQQSRSLRVLIVDDNEAAANGLATLLKHVGNEVETAYLGADVAEKVRAFNPGVVVLDIGLPDMTGYEVAEQLRTHGFRGRIIALTGYGQDEDKKKAEAAGFDHHLTKPVGLADLQAVLMPAT